MPHDVHDWDVAASPAVITTKAGRRRAMAAGKDGFLHAIDIADNKVAWKTPVTTIDNIEAPVTPEGTHFCPGTAGGVQWNGAAFSPRTGMLYVPSVDWCATFTVDREEPRFVAGAGSVGAGAGAAWAGPNEPSVAIAPKRPAIFFSIHSSSSGLR